jgi:branched-chain amino acid transport system permease protein
VTEFWQQVVNGLTLGSVYALVALGYTMVFGVLELIAFAQAGVYMVGAFAGIGVASMVGLSWPIALPITLVAAGAAGGVLNLAIDRVAYRPIRNAGRLAPLISGIGVYIFLENAAGLWIGLQPKVYPTLLPGGHFVVGGVLITVAQLVVCAVALVFMALLTWIVLGTDTGLAMRAVAERPETSSLVGVDPERVIMITFVLGGVLSAVAGVLVGSYVGVASPTMGFIVGIKAFTAAVIGGIGNIPGALVGGLVVGMLETFGAGYIASAWSDAFVFVMLILVLMFRPYGLLGAKLPQRA